MPDRRFLKEFLYLCLLVVGCCDGYGNKRKSLKSKVSICLNFTGILKSKCTSVAPSPSVLLKEMGMNPGK